MATPLLPTPASRAGDVGIGTASINPNLTLGDDLRKPKDVQVLTFTSTMPNVPYLRAVTLSSFNGKVWLPDRTDSTPVGRGAGFGDVPVDPEIKVEEYQTKVTIQNLVTQYLPIPFPAVAIDGLTGQWAVMPQNRTVIGSTTTVQGLSYEVITDLPEPTLEQIRAASARLGNSNPYDKSLPPNTPATIGGLGPQLHLFRHGRWSLISRIQYSAGLYKQTTLNALNLWALLAAGGSRYPGLAAPSDRTHGLLGLTDQRWGILLTVVACVALALPLIRKGGKERLVLTSMATLFAIFMLQTRMHERYFFPAVALMAAVAALRPRWIPLYAAMASVYFIEVLSVYRWLAIPFGGGRSGFRERGNAGRSAGYLSPNEVRALVAVNLGLLAFLIGHALLDFRKARAERPASEAAPATAKPIALPEPQLFSTWPQR
ncbi:MAG: hypothetical protein J0I66_02550 [Microbacterium sp.]|nr:hypothetical protein [Microbacterium sp.]